MKCVNQGQPVTVPWEDVFELIISVNEQADPFLEPLCKYPINEQYSIWYFDKNQMPPLSLENYFYANIPKCFMTLSTRDLEISGIIQLQNIPTLSLKGQGVFVACIDTGVNFTHPAFLDENGETRIFSFWDQSAPDDGSSTPFFGKVYGKEEINQAINAEDYESIIPAPDPVGHGTAVASIACGSANSSEDFTGAAPESELLVVKLRPARQSLKDYYFIPEDTVCYSESDIMAGISYVQNVAREQDRPVVIFLALGANNGNHAGSGVLSNYLQSLCWLRHHAIVAAVGNEGAARHHFFGTAQSVLTPERVEINVEEDIPGFYAELWAKAPEQFTVAISSPTGEVTPRFSLASRGGNHSFVFEGAQVSVAYRSSGRDRRDLLIFIRVEKAVKGIWTVLVYPENVITGDFHMWLPMTRMLAAPVYFLKSNPDVTLTNPSNGEQITSVGGYNGENGAFFLESGRGFDAVGNIKPDFIAPCVEVPCAGARNRYTTLTGTSASAAITAGACAQVLEWAVVQGNGIGINSLDIRDFLVRGSTRDVNRTYPNKEEGYGKLQVYNSFLNIRK